MTNRCIVKVCPNSYWKTRSKDPNLKYFSFPKNKLIRDKWISACQFDRSWLFGNCPFVCSTHFQQSDFERDLKAELLNLPPKKILKPEAVPSRLLTAQDLKDLEISIRREKFQEYLRKFDENADESSESFFDLIVSNFGFPKILISSSGEELVDENPIPKAIIQAETRQYAPVNVHSDSDCFASFGSANPAFDENVFYLSDLCRLCGTYSDCVKSIIDDTYVDYHELVQKCLPSIQIEDNSLPQIICSRCEDKLVSWSEFLKTCHAVNQKFQSIIRILSSDKKEECETTLLELKPEKSDFNVDENQLNSFHVVEVVDECVKEDKLSNGCSDTNSIQFNDFSLDMNKFSEPNRRKKDGIHKSRPICDICQKTFTCSYTRKIHLRTVHTDERPFFCSICSARFKRKDHMQSHVAVVHNYKIPRPTQRNAKRYKSSTFLCAECGKVFCSKTSYREHNDSVHNDVRKYHCDQCNLSFNRYSKLYHHRVVLNHAKNDFLKSCVFCGLEFQSEIYYIRHMAKHEQVSNCEKCGVEFMTHQDFKDHVAKFHFGNRQYSCDACSKKFSSKTSLFQHRKMHENNEKPFKCEYCNWRFRNRGHLSVHLYRHTGERPYVCSICSKGFKQKGDMRKHKAGHLLSERKKSVISDLKIKVENSL